MDVSRDSTAIVAGSESGAVYLFEQNATAFALLLGDKSFLQKEAAKNNDAVLEEETIEPVKDNTVVTGGVENRVEDASDSSGDTEGKTKTGDNLGMEDLPSEESSSSILGKFDSIKLPFALLIGALAGTVFFLKRKLVKYHEQTENTEDFENLEESDTSGNN